jgi:ABC-type transporter Mla subunit MlaD
LDTRTEIDESLRDALVAAQESAENGTATNELLDVAEDAASRLLRGQDTTDSVAPIKSALKALSEAQDTDTFLSQDKKSKESEELKPLRETTGAQKTLFDTVKQTNPEMAENLGVIRATANNFRKFLASATVRKLRKAIC